MKLRVERNWLVGDTTLGRLFVNNKFFCYTLEDKVRNKKVYGQTAIPYGKYDVDINMSTHFGRMMPEIMNVPNYGGVRIHSGNSTKDTLGCLLVGNDINNNRLINSRETFNKLFKILTDAKNRGEKITIDIIAPDLKPIVLSLGIVAISLFAGIMIYKKAVKKKFIS